MIYHCRQNNFPIQQSWLSNHLLKDFVQMASWQHKINIISIRWEYILLLCVRLHLYSWHCQGMWMHGCSLHPSLPNQHSLLMDESHWATGHATPECSLFAVSRRTGEAPCRTLSDCTMFVLEARIKVYILRICQIGMYVYFVHFL